VSLFSRGHQESCQSASCAACCILPNICLLHLYFLLRKATSSVHHSKQWNSEEEGVLQGTAPFPRWLYYFTEGLAPFPSPSRASVPTEVLRCVYT
jgi:hypothetical protein